MFYYHSGSENLRNIIYPDHYCYALSGPAASLPDALAKPLPEAGMVFAYICEGSVCREPISSFPEFDNYLHGISATSPFKPIE